MFSNGINLNASSYKSLFSSSGGILNVPVNPNAVIYSQFDYVHGIAADNGQRGVPVSRVSILNTLINQLVNMKKTPAFSKEEIGGMNDEQKDALIKQYQQQIQTEIAAAAQAQTGSYGLAGIMPEAGAVISLSI
ncbi:hypothetical protein DYE49_09200 [Treponema rectale]|uniref:Uncharacterized protein n=1 Tax=Treponema rectale TaxID=744512 RepID=A0A840SL31_9SPIR|nr:hypothetical protein [Treponema rectale]MBB5220062.1 hypothetical protein [Treponema rectale]QOS40625.1 hypothetical protein DYE49_09200 [Treponema rectale]